MAKSYRVNTFARINNIMISSLLRLGIKVWSFSLLRVRGRKSGKLIVTFQRWYPGMETSEFPQEPAQSSR
jgi:hypothetical protein